MECGILEILQKVWEWVIENHTIEGIDYEFLFAKNATG